MDTGLQLSVMSLQQAKAYCQRVCTPLKRTPSLSRFRFGAGRSKSLGKIPVVIPTPQKLQQLWIDVVLQDIILLIRIDILDKKYLQILSVFFFCFFLSVFNGLECVRENWRIPITVPTLLGMGPLHTHVLFPIPTRTHP